MLAAFRDHISQEFPELSSQRLLLACSGGLDSCVLVHLCHLSQLNFSIAHCNFRLRGQDSEEDADFVAALAEKLGRPFYLRHFDTLAYVQNRNLSIQMAARELRYLWFSDLMREQGLEVLLTAHHADDSLETFLINLSRGTGLEGLSGIPGKTENLARPLLPFSRQQLQDFASSEGLSWREDHSNADTKYLRNKIRHDIVPLLRELHPTFLANFLKTQEHLSASAGLLKRYGDTLREACFEDAGDHFRISLDFLRQLRPLQDSLHLIFSGYGFRDAQAILALMGAPSGKYLSRDSFRLIKDRDHLLLHSLKETHSPEIAFSRDSGTPDLPVSLILEEVTHMEHTSPHILYVDKETLNPVLTLRKWRKGDYFYPLGMKGKKKISKFFKDEKLDLLAKESQWLLCSGKDIVWVVGRRADERFKVSAETRRICKITWES